MLVMVGGPGRKTAEFGQLLRVYWSVLLFGNFLSLNHLLQEKERQTERQFDMNRGRKTETEMQKQRTEGGGMHGRKPYTQITFCLSDTFLPLPPILGHQQMTVNGFQRRH